MAWNLAIKEDRDWIKICKAKYLDSKNNFLRVVNPPYGSPLQNGIIKLRYWIYKNVKWKVGNGNDMYFWQDHWTKGKPLISFINPIQGV